MIPCGPSVLRAKSSLWNGLLGLWRLDESAGNALDSRGNGYSGTLNGGVTQNASGKIRTAYQFDDVNDTVEITSAGLVASLQSLSSVSISFWASSSVFSNNRCAVSIRQANTNNALSIYPYYNAGGKGGFDGQAVWYNNATIMNPATTVSADNTFRHFVHVSNGATDHKLYVENANIASSVVSKTLVGTLNGVSIGSYDGLVEFYNGKIDHVMIWNRAITQAERDELFQAQ